MNIVVDATVPSVDVGNVVRLHHQVIHGGVETCFFICRTCNLSAGKAVSYTHLDQKVTGNQTPIARLGK